jgi:signal transduction histidine kinase
VQEGSRNWEKLFQSFNQFSLSYEEYESELPSLLILDNTRYRLNIIGIVFLNLIFLALAGYLIIRLINKLILADRSLVRKTIDVETRERERIAADLHDGLGSLLSGLIIHIQVLEKEYESDADLNQKLKHLDRISNNAIQSIEEVINNLNPSVLSRYGLVKSLERIVQRINQLGKTQFTVDASKLDIQFQESTELLLFRICNELINNALKHSNAKGAEFRFFNIKKEFHLVYRDDGVGFETDLVALEENKGGLNNLIRRVESMEGSFRIESEPDEGVEIEIIFRMT